MKSALAVEFRDDMCLAGNHSFRPKGAFHEYRFFSSPASQSLTASIDITRTALEMQQTLSGPDGDVQRTLLMDAVEVSIQIDGAFANRVLQDSA